MWQWRLKIRIPVIDWERAWGHEELDTIWFQVALTVPAIFGLDFEVARG